MYVYIYFLGLVCVCGVCAGKGVEEGATRGRGEGWREGWEEVGWVQGAHSDVQWVWEWGTARLLF